MINDPLVVSQKVQSLNLLLEAQILLDASGEAGIAAMVDHAIHALQSNLDGASGR